MSDFHFNTYVSRDDLAAELCENPEQLMYVLDYIANEMTDPDTLREMIDYTDAQISDKDRFARFYRDLGNEVTNA